MLKKLMMQGYFTHITLSIIMVNSMWAAICQEDQAFGMRKVVMNASRSSLGVVSLTICVSMSPGHTAFTVIPKEATSLATALVKPKSPATPLAKR
jgi:hypothetical protein